MKNLRILSHQKYMVIIAFLLFASCKPLSYNKTSDLNEVFDKSHKMFIEKYQSFLNKENKLVKSWYWYTVEKTPSNNYIITTYHPDDLVILSRSVHSSKDLNIKNGAYTIYKNNGEIMVNGNYINNIKEGEWQESSSKGYYKNGKKDGEWISYIDNTPTWKMIYEKGVLINTEEIRPKVKPKFDANALYTVVDEMPYFGTCAASTKKERNKCTNDLILWNVGMSAEYPDIAREYDIQGVVLASFVVNKKGDVEDVKIVRGLCKEIDDNVKQGLLHLPKFVSGRQYGQKVKVLYNVPVNFKLTKN